jgi:hypothetical protein
MYCTATRALTIASRQTSDPEGGSPGLQVSPPGGTPTQSESAVHVRS